MATAEADYPDAAGKERMVPTRRHTAYCSMEPMPVAAAEPTIDELATRIGRRSNAWRVVLFGSRARGTAREESDYDLYVEVDVPRESLRDAHERIHAILSEHPHQAFIDLHVNPPGEIERRSHDPGSIEWDVAREGKVLYADPRAGRPSVRPRRVRESSSEMPETLAEWLGVADRDLRHARLLLEAQDFWPDVCLQSQQAAEKYMKALLVSRWVRPPRTHKLETLLASLRRAGCELTGLDDACKGLSEYAVTARYAAGLRLGEAEARPALAAAERIVAAVQHELPARG